VPPDRVSATRRVAAPADQLFRIVSDPSGQVAIDGSGMLVAAPDAVRLTAVGQTFDMDMDRRPLGDIPDLAAYQVRNTVTAIVPDRLIEWTVGFGDHPPFGHVYGWQLEPVGEHETDVTNYCDWTAISDEMRAGVAWPVVPVRMLEQSLENLDRLATGTWHTVRADSVERGQRVRIRGTELVATRIEHPFLGRSEMLAFIEDTPVRWLKRPVPVDAEVEVHVPD
jgi:uncharacterized protein YndB with AHSA1/START domain